MVDVDINYHRVCCGLLHGGCGDGGGWSWKTGGKQVEDEESTRSGTGQGDSLRHPDAGPASVVSSACL